jgi:hypothetical protein
MSNRRIRSPRHLHFAVLIAVILALVGTAGAGGAFDGTYKGSQTVLRSRAFWCHLSNSDHYVTVVRNNHFNRGWGGANMNVDVHADGTFHSEGAIQQYRTVKPVSITGKISGDRLEADIGDIDCAIHVSLKKF